MNLPEAQALFAIQKQLLRNTVIDEYKPGSILRDFAAIFDLISMDI